MHERKGYLILAHSLGKQLLCNLINLTIHSLKKKLIVDAVSYKCARCRNNDELGR